MIAIANQKRRHRRTIQARITKISKRDDRVITGITVECGSREIEIPVNNWFIPHQDRMPKKGSMIDVVIEPDDKIGDLYFRGSRVPLC